jgi:hypothetical protein
MFQPHQTPTIPLPSMKAPTGFTWRNILQFFGAPQAFVPKVLYHQYQVQGLLDPDHILGMFWSRFNVPFFVDN